MTSNNRIKPVKLSTEKELKTLVENRTSYTLEQCELNVFETHTTSFRVPLTFNDLVVTSMMRGKKVMHLFDHSGFDYLPGESVIVPPKVTMNIDFPEANHYNPTQCIALAIDNFHIQQTLHDLNERYPKSLSGQSWQLNYDQFHFYNNEEIAQLINKLIHVCSSQMRDKDVLADLALKELVVRVIQTQHLHANDHGSFNNSNPLSYIIGYINSNINQKIQIAELSDKACMSKATFYRIFKREFGMSPLDYILREKINRAKHLLLNTNQKVISISYELGFTDVNYFIRYFKKSEGITPAQYRLARSQKRAD